MKKSAALFLLLLVIFTFPAASAPVHMVIMLDTSEKVSDIYNHIIDKIIKNILTGYLRYGDTLHFISFSSDPSLIFSKQIRTGYDIEYLMSELFLIKPAGKYTDLIKALRFLNQYAANIGSGADGSRQILIITDGIHSPAPGSIFSDYSFISHILNETVKNLLRLNWKISAVELPVSDNISESADGSNLFHHITEEPRIYHTNYYSYKQNDEQISTGPPGIVFSHDYESVNYNFNLPAIFLNYYNYPVFLKLDKILDIESGTDLLKEKITINLNPEETRKIDLKIAVPYTVEKGNMQLNLKLIFSDNYRAGPDSVTVETYLKKSFTDYLISMKEAFFKILVFVFISGTVVLFIIFLKYYTGVTISETSLTDSARRPVVMKVQGQNNNVLSEKNINYFTADSVKTVGGVKSSFSILIYNIPENIAEIKYNGELYFFKPLVSRYFPDITEKEIMIKSGGNIKVRSDRGKIFFITFEEYISPLEKVNSILKKTERRAAARV